MHSIKKKIENLREEIEDLEQKISNQLDLRDGGKKDRIHLERAQNLKIKLLPEIEEYKKISQQHQELDRVRRDTLKSFKENSFLYRLFSFPQIPDGLMNQLENIWDEEKKKYNEILNKVKSIEDLPESYEWALYWIDKKELSRDEAIRKINRALETEVSEQQRRLNFEENFVEEDDPFIMDYKKDLERKQKKLEKLTNKLKKQQRKKGVISAYQNKSRNLASTIKAGLVNHKVCPYCEKEIQGEAEADHIYPVSLGGLSTSENMVYVCKQCNRKKDQLTLREFINKYSLDRERIERNLNSLGKKF